MARTGPGASALGNLAQVDLESRADRKILEPTSRAHLLDSFCRTARSHALRLHDSQETRAAAQARRRLQTTGAGAGPPGRRAPRTRRTPGPHGRRRPPAESRV